MQGKASQSLIKVFVPTLREAGILNIGGGEGEHFLLLFLHVFPRQLQRLLPPEFSIALLSSQVQFEGANLFFQISKVWMVHISGRGRLSAQWAGENRVNLVNGRATGSAQLWNLPGGFLRGLTSAKSRRRDNNISYLHFPHHFDFMEGFLKLHFFFSFSLHFSFHIGRHFLFFFLILLLKIFYRGIKIGWNKCTYGMCSWMEC